MSDRLLNTTLGGEPQEIPVDVSVPSNLEICKYLYLPIKLPSGKIVLPDRLKWITNILRSIVGNYLIQVGKLDTQYMYLSYEYNYFHEASIQNRLGWHVDGYGTDDETYLLAAFNRTTRVLKHSKLEDSGLTHKESLEYFEAQAKADPDSIRELKKNTLYRLGKAIHAAPRVYRGPRLFIKVVISSEKFNLLGNSINYKLDYNWKYYERSELRNDPVYILGGE